jgi:hypothetical protein
MNSMPNTQNCPPECIRRGAGRKNCPRQAISGGIAANKPIIKSRKENP